MGRKKNTTDGDKSKTTEKEPWWFDDPFDTSIPWKAPIISVEELAKQIDDPPPLSYFKENIPETPKKKRKRERKCECNKDPVEEFKKKFESLKKQQQHDEKKETSVKDQQEDIRKILGTDFPSYKTSENISSRGKEDGYTNIIENGSRKQTLNKEGSFQDAQEEDSRRIIDINTNLTFGKTPKMSSSKLSGETDADKTWSDSVKQEDQSEESFVHEAREENERIFGINTEVVKNETTSKASDTEYSKKPIKQGKTKTKRDGDITSEEKSQKDVSKPPPRSKIASGTLDSKSKSKKKKKEKDYKSISDISKELTKLQSRLEYLRQQMAEREGKSKSSHDSEKVTDDSSTETEVEDVDASHNEELPKDIPKTASDGPNIEKKHDYKSETKGQSNDSMENEREKPIEEGSKSAISTKPSSTFPESNVKDEIDSIRVEPPAMTKEKKTIKQDDAKLHTEKPKEKIKSSSKTSKKDKTKSKKKKRIDKDVEEMNKYLDEVEEKMDKSPKCGFHDHDQPVGGGPMAGTFYEEKDGKQLFPEQYQGIETASESNTMYGTSPIPLDSEFIQDQHNLRQKFNETSISSFVNSTLQPGDGYVVNDKTKK